MIINKNTRHETPDFNSNGCDSHENNGDEGNKDSITEQHQFIMVILCFLLPFFGNFCGVCIHRTQPIVRRGPAPLITLNFGTSSRFN